MRGGGKVFRQPEVQIAMVSPLSSILLVAQSSAELPPPVRAVAMMALLGIVLLGLLLIASILLGGHWVRRLGGHRRGPSVPPDFIPKKTTPPSNPPAINTKLLNGETARIDDTRHS